MNKFWKRPKVLVESTFCFFGLDLNGHTLQSTLHTDLFIKKTCEVGSTQKGIGGSEHNTWPTMLIATASETSSLSYWGDLFFRDFAPGRGILKVP